MLGSIKGQKLAGITYVNELNSMVKCTLVIAEGIKGINWLIRKFDWRKADIEKHLNIRMSHSAPDCKILADTEKAVLHDLPFNTNSKTYIQLYFVFEDKKYKLSSNHVNCPVSRSDEGGKIQIKFFMHNGVPRVQYHLPSFIYTRSVDCIQCTEFPTETGVQW